MRLAEISWKGCCDLFSSSVVKEAHETYLSCSQSCNHLVKELSTNPHHYKVIIFVFVIKYGTLW